VNQPAASARRPILELRVLSGLHREASCAARDGAVVGADPDCDIVLADAGLGPRAARLRIGDHGWDLAPEEGAPAHEPATPFNQALPLGPVWVTVARSDDPWTGLPEAANDGMAVDPIADPTPAAAPTAVLTAVPEAQTADAKPAAPTLTASSPPWRQGEAASSRRAAWPLLLGLAAVVLAVVVAISMAWLLPTAPKPVEHPDPQLAAKQSLPKIAAIIERLGLAGRLQADMTGDGTVRVTGWVRNAAEQDALSAALAQIWPMPSMRVSVEESIGATAAAILRSFPIAYQARYDGSGRLTVHGIAPGPRERSAALSALNAQLPGMTILGNDIMLAPDVLDELSGRLTAAGLAGVGLTWRDNKLEAGTSNLSDEQLEALREVVDKFNATHLGVVALGKPTVEGMQFADSVPFGIRSVVSGPQPFIVLDDGSKLLVGGTYKQYRLTAVEPRRIIFDGPRPAIVLR